ncbi:unnamed protein product [Durusdinium trenchii]|uniref:Uncharacterized protein n=2 Tax=Durusdinium trenchii TaxID=1381693 RepID=A0ABP0P5G4_9DINO
MELDASRSRFILQSCLLYFGMAQNQSGLNKELGMSQALILCLHVQQRFTFHQQAWANESLSDCQTTWLLTLSERPFRLGRGSSNLIMALGLEPPSGKLLLAAKRKVQFEAVIKPPPSVEPVGRTESFKKHLLCHLPKDQVEHTNQHDAHDGGVN